MDVTAFSPEILREKIERAQQRRDQAYAEYESASRELQWLQEGLRLFSADDSDRAGDTLLRELLPEGAQTRRPTLRQAIILVMRASPRAEWTTSEIANALAMNGWTPPRGEPTKRVSDMASVMVSEGHLNRTGRGTYKLSTLLGDALRRALPPITDYRVAALHGLPVPDRPAASEGLRDG